MVAQADMTIGNYAWYVGRFLGCCEMLREPELYTRDEVIKQMLVIQDEYEREKAEKKAAPHTCTCVLREGR